MVIEITAGTVYAQHKSEVITAIVEALKIFLFDASATSLRIAESNGADQ